MTQKTKLGTKIGRILVLLFAIGAGIGIIAFFVSRIQPPERVVAAENQIAVRAVIATPAPFNIQATGFGTAAPSRTWSAVSNAKGRIIFRHDNLESGELLSAGTLILEIDPALYQLALREADAEIASVEAEIEQLNQEATNSRLLLDLERQRLELAETSLTRTTSLVASGSVPQASLDTQLRATLQQRQAVQALINQQNIMPIQLNRLASQKERTLAKRAQVGNDLADTKIFAPFDMRVSDVNVEMHQYINPGQTLFSGDGIKSSEVVLQVPMQSLRRVLNELPQSEGLEREFNISALDARVQLVGSNQMWEASVKRIANGIDPATRTVRVVLDIEQPLLTADLDTNPPLPKGMFVQGVLGTQMIEPQMVLPQASIHQGWVYLVNSENRLERREVETAFHQDGQAVIISGLEPGETVILDDIVPAISGMLLDPKIIPAPASQLSGANQ